MLAVVLERAVAMPWELRRRQNPPDRSRGHLEGRAEFKRSPGYAGQRKKGRTGHGCIQYSLYTYRTLIKEGGKATRELGERALLEWGETEYFGPFAGMTTRNAINRLKKDASMSAWAYAGHLGNKLYKGHYYALSSNGAASKAYPEGLISNGNMDQAIADTVEITMDPTTTLTAYPGHARLQRRSARQCAMARPYTG